MWRKHKAAGDLQFPFLRVGHAPQDSQFGFGVSSFVHRADFSLALHKASQTTLETLTQASSSTKQHKPAASRKISQTRAT